jgi:hypothetical protein
VSSKLEEVNAAFDELVAQLLQKSPADRPRSADEVRSLLEKIRSELRESETNVGVVRRASGATLPVFGAPRPSPKVRSAAETAPLVEDTEPSPPVQRSITSSEQTVPLAPPRVPRPLLFALVPLVIVALAVALWAATHRREEPVAIVEPPPPATPDTPADNSPPVPKGSVEPAPKVEPVVLPGVRRNPLQSKRGARVNQLRARLKQQIADAKRRVDDDAWSAILDKREQAFAERLARAQTDAELDTLNTEIEKIPSWKPQGR